MEKVYDTDLTQNAVALVPEHEMLTVDSVKKERILSIDRFRGLCMFAMVCSYFLGLFSGAFEAFAPIITHFRDGMDTEGIFMLLPGMSFADLFAPMFIFVIGLSMVHSFRSREKRYGTTRAFVQLAARFAGIIGMGMVIAGLESGWSGVISGDWANFDAIPHKAVQIFAAWFVLQCCLLVLLIVSRFFKSDKIKKPVENVFRFSLVVAGVLGVYFILVATAEKFTPPEAPRYGDWVWDVLPHIGLSGLLALPFLKFNKWGRLAAAAVLFFVMAVLYENGLYPQGSSIVEGGFIGGFGGAQIVLLGTVFSDLKDDKSYWVLTSLVLLVAVFCAVSLGLHVAKRGYTPTYCWFSAGVAAVIWGAFNLISKWQPKFDFLKVWGANAIVTYITTILVCMIVGMFKGDEAAAMSAGAAVPIVLVVLAVYTVVQTILDKKKIYIRV